MMKFKVLAAVAALTGALLAGCGGGGSDPVQGPVIGSEPASATVAAGGSATFTVSATGKGSLSYQWYVNGTAVD